MSNKIMLEQKSKYLTSIRVFPLLFQFFCWNEINKKSLIKEKNCKAHNIAEKTLQNLLEIG